MGEVDLFSCPGGVLVDVIHQLPVQDFFLEVFMDWCYLVILIDFRLAPLFACSGLILIIGKIIRTITTYVLLLCLHINAMFADGPSRY
jgi:hypothetical protein